MVPSLFWGAWHGTATLKEIKAAGKNGKKKKKRKKRKWPPHKKGGMDGKVLRGKRDGN